MNWLKRKLKNESILWIYLLGAAFFIIYGYANFYTSKLTNVPSSFFPWEIHIPFISWMIVPYMSSDIVFIIAFLLPPNKSYVRVLAKRVAFAILFSALCYFIFPLKYAFIKPPTTDSIFNPLFALLTADLPYNQCPSLHISQGFIFWAVFYHAFKGRVSRFFIHAWFILIYISTLTVYQHHFVDLLGGQLVGLASFVLFPYKEKAEFRNNRFAFIYYFVSFALFSASFFTPLFFTAISLYLSLSYFLVGFLYQFPEKNLIVKTNGRHSLMVKFLFGHFMLSCWLIWFYASLKSKIKYAEVLPNIYFGERPNNIEDTPIKLNENWAVIDLAPEISAHPDLVKLDYHYFPFNDLSYPKKEWLHSITDVIDDLLRKGKKVYVHCRLGQTRSALVICAYLIFKQNHSPKEALELVSSLKKINLAYDLRKIFTDSDPY